MKLCIIMHLHTHTHRNTYKTQYKSFNNMNIIRIAITFMFMGVFLFFVKYVYLIVSTFEIDSVK